MKRLDARQELLARVTAAGSQKRAAEDLGLSTAYLCDMLAGRRGISDRVLAKLGLARQETIVRTIKCSSL